MQFGYVLALLAGLLLLSVHWSLAIALAAIGVALIVRGIIVRSSSATAPPGTATDRTVA
jgi:hypothetical protein